MKAKLSIFRICSLLTYCSLWFSTNALAHDLSITRAAASITSDLAVEVALVTAINPAPNAKEPANISLQLHLLEQTIRNETQILADDTALPFSIEMPSELAVLRSQMLTLNDYAHDTRGYTIVIKTILPAETKLLSFNFPTIFKAVSLAIAKPNSPAWLTLINAGERSQAFPVQGNSVPETLESEPLYSILMSNYLKLGFFHILPLGLDHILFIVGLFLLNPSWRPLLAQATAFTIAHSITLGLAAAGIFSLSSSLVEPLIAASIAFVGIENIAKQWQKSCEALKYCMATTAKAGFGCCDQV